MKRLIEKTVFWGVGHRLALSDGADEPLARGREGHDRRRGPASLGVLDDGRLATLEHSHT